MDRAHTTPANSPDFACPAVFTSRSSSIVRVCRPHRSTMYVVDMRPIVTDVAWSIGLSVIVSAAQTAEPIEMPVSYTHLTLPTNREV